jgi:hypothetical protein
VLVFKPPALDLLLGSTTPWSWTVDESWRRSARLTGSCSFAGLGFEENENETVRDHYSLVQLSMKKTAK